MAAKKTAAGTIKMKFPGGNVPRVMILGRGQMHGRKLHAVRVRPEVMERLASVISGPMYLALELCVMRYLDLLDKQPAGQAEIIHAESLG